MSTRDEVYIQSQVACALIEMQGMVAANVQAHISRQPHERDGQDLPFKKQDFDDLIVKYGIHHNAVLSVLDGR